MTKAVQTGWLSALSLGLVLTLLLWLLNPTALLPLGSGFLLSALSGWVAVPLLRQLKIRQVVRANGPQAHKAKSGTPTMGGVFWVPPALLVALLFSPSCAVWAVCALSLGFGLVGFWDDWLVITSRPGGPRGMAARPKMALLLGIALLFCLYLALSGHPPVLLDWQGQVLLALGLLYWPLSLFVLTGTSNAVNFTDGLDGLAAGTGAVACAALGCLVNPDLAAACWGMTGACLGFLVYNHNPAKVFMGDTGSLALGGFLAGVGLLSGQLLPLLVLSAVFVAEAVSVILQISYFKLTKGPDGQGKRLFRMAPLHHHLELSGWSETLVVRFFYLIALASAGVTLLAVRG